MLIGTSPDSPICSMSPCNDYVAILVSSVNVSRDATCGYVVVVISLLECLSSGHSILVHFTIVLRLQAAAKEQVKCSCWLHYRAQATL